MQMPTSAFSIGRISGSLSTYPRINDLNPRALEVPHVARDQDNTTGAAYGRDLAVSLADWSACMAALNRNLRVGSGSGAIKWQNPLPEAMIKPVGHGSLQYRSSPAGR